MIWFENNKTSPLNSHNNSNLNPPKKIPRFLSKNIELRRQGSSFPFAVGDHQGLRYGNPPGDENERNYTKQVWKH